MEHTEQLYKSYLQRIANILTINGGFSDNQGLYTGEMGIALFFFRYSRFTQNELFSDFSFDLIGKIQNSIHLETPIEYKQGLAGIDSAIEYLVQCDYIQSDTDDVLEEIDARIFDLDKFPCLSMDDLLSMGYYALWRIAGNSVRKQIILETVLPQIVHLHSPSVEFEIVKEDQYENWKVPEVFNHYTLGGSRQDQEDYCRNVIYLLRLHIKDTKDLVFHINYNHCQFFAKELKTAFDCKTVATVHFLNWAFELNGNLSFIQSIRSKPEDQQSSHEKWISSTFENERLLYNEIDQVIALSADMKNVLCDEYQLHSDSITIVPNGLVDMRSEKDNDKDSLRKKWYIPERENLILFAGRLHPMKGIVFFIRAFRKVLEKIPDCRLMIAGSGNYDMYFKETREISSKISFNWIKWTVDRLVFA